MSDGEMHPYTALELHSSPRRIRSIFSTTSDTVTSLSSIVHKAMLTNAGNAGVTLSKTLVSTPQNDAFDK